MDVDDGPKISRSAFPSQLPDDLKLVTEDHSRMAISKSCCHCETLVSPARSIRESSLIENWPSIDNNEMKRSMTTICITICITIYMTPAGGALCFVDFVSDDVRQCDGIISKRERE